MRARPTSDLRRRMLADMTIRSFSDKTKNDYPPCRGAGLVPRPATAALSAHTEE